eukprot:11320431-Alexandrium_andersonii.AAC.1
MVSGPGGDGGDDAEPRSSTVVAVGTRNSQRAKRLDAMDGPCEIPRAKGVCVGVHVYEKLLGPSSFHEVVSEVDTASVQLCNLSFEDAPRVEHPLPGRRFEALGHTQGPDRANRL